MLLPLREIISVCVCVCENKGKNERFFFSHETRETFKKNYCNWFDNSEIIRSLSRGFSLQRERVFCVNICVIVCDYYFGLLNICNNIIWDPTCNHRKLKNAQSNNKLSSAQHSSFSPFFPMVEMRRLYIIES